MNARTTVTMDKEILEQAKQKAKYNKESLTSLLNRATVNQLEKEEMFGARYELEGNESDD